MPLHAEVIRTSIAVARPAVGRGPAAEDHDDRVVPSHSFKLEATRQQAQSGNRPVLTRVQTQRWHGYRPTDKRIAERAEEWAFALANTNVTR